MAVKLRLRRMGSSKKPFFRIVAADARSANAGSFLEEIGWYDPTKKDEIYKLDLPAAEAWISKGAQPSDTVKSLIKKARIAAAKAPPAAEEAPAVEAPTADAPAAEAPAVEAPKAEAPAAEAEAKAPAAE